MSVKGAALSDQRHLFLMCKENPAAEVFGGRCGASRGLVTRLPSGLLENADVVTSPVSFWGSVPCFSFARCQYVISDLTRLQQNSVHPGRHPVCCVTARRLRSE